MLCIAQSFQKTGSLASDPMTPSERVESAITTKLLKRVIQQKNRLISQFLVFFFALAASFKHTPLLRAYLSMNDEHSKVPLKILKDDDKSKKDSRKPEFSFYYVALVSTTIFIVSLFIVSFSILLWYNLFVVFIAPVFIITIAVVLSAQSFFDKLSVWNSICKRMGIQDEVLYRVVGIHTLPWVRNKPFNCFLPKSRSYSLNNLEDSTDLT
jgi:hypothetical protein